MKRYTEVGLFLSMVAFPPFTSLGQEPGANTYNAKCATCHAADGSGSTPAGKATKTPSFNSPEMLKMSDAEFLADTRNGKGKMPAYAGKLSEKEITDSVAYIRTLQKK